MLRALPRLLLAPKSDPRLVRPLWRGRRDVDALTIACLLHAEQILGYQLAITQGSYQSSVAASAGTHDRGGVVDISVKGMDTAQRRTVVRALRLAGMAAWWRTPAQGDWPDHIHAVVSVHPDLAPAAARQVEALRRGENGLAGRGPDDGPRVIPLPAPVWPWPPKKKRPVEVRAAIKRLRARLAVAGPVEAKRIRAAIAKLKEIKPR